MRIMGIDYGSKRIGIALSDDNAEYAFPNCIITNDRRTHEYIKKIVEEMNVGHVVIGQSFDSKGMSNKISEKICFFAEKLHSKLQIPISFEPEYFTTIQARHFIGEKYKKVDASAAAIILQSYIDRSKNINKFNKN